MNTITNTTTLSEQIRGFLTGTRNARTASAKWGNPDKEFLAIIAVLVAIAVLAINMILPAFDQITRHFELVDSTSVGLTVSLLYLGLALGQVVLGPVSDSIGRKNALTFGITIFLAGCMIAGMANSFQMLVVGQIIQGFGLGAPRVITLAILRDRFSGNAMASAMSFVMIMFVLAPTFAPFIGKIIVTSIGWRFLFVVYAMMGAGLVLLILFRLPETLPRAKRQTFSLGSVWRSQIAVLKNTQAIGYSLALGLITGPFIAYLNMSQKIFEFQYLLGTSYPVVFALLSLWIGAASFVNGLIVQTVGMERLVSFALAAIVVASGLASAGIAVGHMNLPLGVFVIYMGTVLFCFGLLVSNLNALAMANMADAAGTGAAAIGALTTLISVPIAIGVGGFFSENAAPVAFGFVICGLLSFIIHLIIQFSSVR